MNSNLPNMADVVNIWSENIYCYVIKKELKNYVLEETKTFLRIKGMFQNAKDTDLQIKTDGQREWRYYKLHSTYDKLNNDDIIEIDNIRYRIKSKSQDKKYGFTRYILLEDYRDE